MLQLTNLSTHPSDKAMFDDDTGKVAEYIRRLGLDGLEAAQGNRDELEWFPKGSIKGVHMRYWPTWLDFWRGDKAALREQFGDEETLGHYYIGKEPEDMAKNYRDGLILAEAFGAKYAVFHACHVRMEDIYTFKFSYTPEEVLDAFIELINMALTGLDCDIMLLFENLWWPGLTLIDELAAMRFLDRVRWDNKGFMLDTGHMMITNPSLRGYKASAEYICDTLLRRPAVLRNIRGMHLNYSPTGEYIEKIHKGEAMTDIEGDYWTRFIHAIGHIKQIDMHIPFGSPEVNRILELVRPGVLVHELLADDLPTLEGYVAAQMKACAETTKQSGRDMTARL